MKSILTIKSNDKLLTVVYDHVKQKFTPDIEHDEGCLRIMDNAIVETHAAAMMWPDFDDLNHAREYRCESIEVSKWVEDFSGSIDEKFRFLSFLSKVRVDVDDNGDIEFVKDRYMKHAG